MKILGFIVAFGFFAIITIAARAILGMSTFSESAAIWICIGILVHDLYVVLDKKTPA